jgi:hypothetical protein
MPSYVARGCGVTAYDRDDALRILQHDLFGREPIPKIVSVIEDVDISSLDRGHVIPNMEVPIWRGI